ncbi:signal peptide peptidase SppA [Saccharospirillum salsuginis]|uniref:Peptidase S49 domain-containing protein n=1 Tax=Saccharospirillum salsuginis TaxID=418750 RepID=A0A918KH92_9GAMM|nr:signal peptide peptidase SppA [Saccharospirillum salsuginis]GGX62611.1 hypothetical protein GCM10007392_33140 [Saccharospirillum salsuginis]
MTHRTTLLIALLLPAAMANAEDIGFKRYYQANEFSMTSPGAQRFGLYGYDNPAGLHYLKGGDASLHWTSDDFLYDDQRWQAIFAGPGVSFSFGRDNRGPGQVSDYKLSFGGGTDDASAGLSIGWYRGDTDAQDLRTHFTLGTLTRPNRYTSLGLTGTIATDADYYEGVVDLSVRPLGTPALTLFADYALGNDQDFADGNWSVGGSSEIMPGVRLTGRYFDTETVTLGFAVSLGHSGISAQSHQPNEGDAYQSYGVRLGSWDRNVFDAWSGGGDDYLELALDDRMSYQTLGFFDRRQSLLDTLRTIEAARIDDSIEGIVINSTNMQVPPTMAWEIKTALDGFRASGKRVVMYIERGQMTELLLSSAADEVIMDPVGTLTVPGFVSGTTYLGELLDHWGVGVEELRNLEYKTAFESLSRSEMSRADREQRQALIDDFYALWQTSMQNGRGLSASDFDNLIDRGIVLSPRELQRAGVVDRLGRYADMEDTLEDIAGGKRDTVEPNGLRVMRTANDHRWGPAHQIAVLYATGMTATDNGMNTRELAETLRELREDNTIKAVVLRVDSPGGDILAADLLAQEVKKTQEEKPVVVSMGNLAASGGYWISMHAGTLIAAPNTVTGSIGVTSVRLWDEGVGDKLRLSSDFVSRGDSADANAGIGLPLGISLPHRPLTDEERDRIMDFINEGYDEFVRQAAEARGMTEGEMRQLAAGRIYSGRDALEVGLVDELGSLTDAIDAAREQAGLTDRDKVMLVEKPNASLSNWNDLLYMIEADDRASVLFNASLYNQRYLKFLAEQRGEPLVLLPYEYFEGSLTP